MAISIKLAACRNPMDETASEKHYAQVVTSGKRNLKLLAKRIAAHTTMGVGDIYGVLLSLEEEIVYAMEDGVSVELGDICIFYPAVQSEGVENTDDFNTGTHIKKKSIKVRIKKVLSDKMTKIPVEWAA